MRLIALIGTVALAATGCETTKHSTSCAPCARQTSCAVAPGSPAPTAVPSGKPAVLPPTIREVRGSSTEDFAEPRLQQASANPQQDVLLIPRWVYVPYSPHVAVGQMKLPNGQSVATVGPSVQMDDRVTVMPPMGTPPAANQNETLEQCLQQMKALNARIGELEAKTVAKSGTISAVMPASGGSQMLPLPPVPTPMMPPSMK